MKALRAAWPHLSTAITVISFIVGVLWFVGKPLAEDFVEGVVDQNIESRLSRLERSFRSIEADNAARAGEVAVQHEKLKHIDDLINRQDATLLQILREIRRENR